jgi:hypothetical protein
MQGQVKAARRKARLRNKNRPKTPIKQAFAEKQTRKGNRK